MKITKEQFDNSVLSVINEKDDTTENIRNFVLGALTPLDNVS